MSSQRLSPTLLALCLFTMGTGYAYAQSARTTASDAMSAFPCPSGDASCAKRLSSAPEKPVKHKHHKNQHNIEPQNSLEDSNPNQKIENAPSGDVDEDVTEDIQEMNNREAMPHNVNRPK
jgi:hypothetical protein